MPKKQTCKRHMNKQQLVSIIILYTKLANSAIIHGKYSKVVFTPLTKFCLESKFPSSVFLSSTAISILLTSKYSLMTLNIIVKVFYFRILVLASFFIFPFGVCLLYFSIFYTRVRVFLYENNDDHSQKY